MEPTLWEKTVQCRHDVKWWLWRDTCPKCLNMDAEMIPRQKPWNTSHEIIEKTTNTTETEGTEDWGVLSSVYYHYYCRNELLTEICHPTINCQQTVMLTEHTRGSFYVEYYWGLPWLCALWGPLKSLLFFTKLRFFLFIFSPNRESVQHCLLCFHTGLGAQVLSAHVYTLPVDIMFDQQQITWQSHRSHSVAARLCILG